MLSLFLSITLQRRFLSNSSRRRRHSSSLNHLHIIFDFLQEFTDISQRQFTVSIMDNSSSFDPYQQSFTLQDADGNSFNVTIPDVDSFVQYNNQILINYGSQFGACIVLLFVLGLLTKENKRGSPIFIVNTLALIFNILGNITAIVYFTGPFTEAYAYFAGDFSRVHRVDYATQVATTVLFFLVMICVEISLCLQTRAVCVTLSKMYRYIIYAISFLIASVSIAVRLALCIENGKAIVNLDFTPVVVLSATNITTTLTICWFCAVFLTKLGFALHQRKKLGLGKFGPMQIIFIMGCQSLFVPGMYCDLDVQWSQFQAYTCKLVIFCILVYTTSVPAIDSNVLTSVCIFLPLSSLWASASLDSRFKETQQKQFGRKIIPSYATGSATRDSKHPLSPSHPAMTQNSIDGGANMASKDLEAQGL